MSEDNNETTHILILKSETRALIQAETYLRNRKFVVGSVTSIKESLGYIVAKKPTIILISADIPSKKIKVLPKMLSQAFPIKCVGFCEQNSGMSVRTLGELRLEYVLYPPVSGPAIERLILKMKKDEEQRALQASANPANDLTASGQSKSGSIEVKGAPKTPLSAEAINNLLNSDSLDDDSSNMNHIHSGSSSGMAYSGNLGQESSHPEKAPGYIPGQGSNSGSQGHYNPGETGGGSGAGNYVPGMGSGGSSGNSHSQTDSKSSQGGYNPTHGNANSGGAYNPNQAGSGMGPGGQTSGGAPASNAQQAGESFEQWAERMRNAATQQSGNKSNMGNTSQGGPGMGPGFQGGENTNATGKSEGYTLESEYVPKKKKKAYRFETDSKQDLTNEKLIIRGTQTSLDQTVMRSEDLDADSVAQVEKASNIACITIESPKFSGYLICALGKNRKIDQNFVAEVQAKLVKFLVDNGEPAKEKDTLDMKIQEVDFTDWALQEAEFLRTSVHNGDEVAMAFFPTNDLEVKLEDSASEKMVKLSIDDLKEDTVVEFDLYIFMPGNNKYLLYTPQGMPFYGKQKNRLKEKGVSHIHLRKENALSVKKYKAQNFLNEKIESYKAAKRLREA